MPEKFADHVGPINKLDKVALVLLSGVLILVGVFPSVIAPLVESGAESVLRLFGGA
jgi:hypothetical protein